MRTALVTGAAGGIGTALVGRFDEEGYRVVGLDVDEPAKTPADGWIRKDLAKLAHDEDAAERLADETVDALDGSELDVLVNNAAVQRLAAVEEISLDDWRETLDVNLTAAFRLTQALLPALERAEGAVVNVTSIHACQTKPHFVAYATSKAGLEGLTRAMAVELGDRVRVNAVAPAAVETEMLREGLQGTMTSLDRLGEFHPSGRVAQPEEVAEAILFLASDQCRATNGSVLPVTAGIRGRLHDPE